MSAAVASKAVFRRWNAAISSGVIVNELSASSSASSSSQPNWRRNCCETKHRNQQKRKPDKSPAIGAGDNVGVQEPNPALLLPSRLPPLLLPLPLPPPAPAPALPPPAQSNPGPYLFALDGR